MNRAVFVSAVLVLCACGDGAPGPVTDATSPMDSSGDVTPSLDAGSPNLPPLQLPAAAPIRFTWLGVTNWLVQFGDSTVMFDGYFIRPEGEGVSAGEGMEILGDVLEAKDIDTVAYIFVGHSHFDHIMDVGQAALFTDAQVIGSATTCFITQAQGLPADRCTVVREGDTLDVVEAQVRVIRTIHWLGQVSTIGGYQVLDEVPALEDISGAPNGGTLSYHFVFPPEQRRSFFMQGSLGDIDSDDGSNMNYRQNLNAAFEGFAGYTVWFGTGNFLMQRSQLAPYLESIRPTWIVPHHWDPLSPTLRAGINVSFQPQDWYNDALAEAGIRLVPTVQYFDEFILDSDGLRRQDESPIRASEAFAY